VAGQGYTPEGSAGRPEIRFRKTRRTEVEAQMPEHLEKIRGVLHDQGFVLLPSDTAYSIAAWLRTAEMRQQINELLFRENEPISLAFPSLQVVRDWTVENKVADELLKCFTSGPITVVRSASRRIPAEYTRKLLNSLNHTIGVRIPNSAEERQVAGVGKSPITTVPVLDRSVEGQPRVVTSFTQALGIIQERIEAIGGPPWCAIEGEILYTQTSTVVEVLGEDGT
jgi:tRNA A37 threonylcarbamoyladenosine synthetase subunit TsaC/SUA5/YrdC